MARPEKNEEREERIIMEAVVDAYDEGERAIGWYYYLENKISFPFKAKCRERTVASPLKIGRTVSVIGMAPVEECESEMLVLIEYDDDELAVPLEQLTPLSKDPDTQEAVEDWHYWVAQGYQF